MIGLLALMLLRPLLAPLARLGAGFLVAAILAVGARATIGQALWTPTCPGG